VTGEVRGELVRDEPEHPLVVVRLAGRHGQRPVPCALDLERDRAGRAVEHVGHDRVDVVAVDARHVPVEC
jgi:hypothetical protein